MVRMRHNIANNIHIQSEPASASLDTCTSQRQKNATQLPMMDYKKPTSTTSCRSYDITPLPII